MRCQSYAVICAALLFAAAATQVVAQPARYLEQRQDHFDGGNANTWLQAYYVNDSQWLPGSRAPVFLCIGGEGPPLDGSVVTSSPHCNDAVEWLHETGAIMFALEHRYYGCHNMSACPVASFSSPDDLRFLSSAQALEDLALFISYATHAYNLSGCSWVTWGGSYPGMLSGWLRLKYPHLVHAAVASSAPVRIVVEMQQYNDAVAAAFAVEHEEVGGSSACEMAIRKGHESILSLMSDDEGRERLAVLFGRSAQWYESPANRVAFAGGGVAVFDPQDNDVTCSQPCCNISGICRVMLNASIGDAVDRLAAVAQLQNVTGGEGRSRRAAAAAATRMQRLSQQQQTLPDFWSFQTCAEFGGYMTCNIGSRCFFSQGLLTLPLLASFCPDTFNISLDAVAMNVAATNTRYGSDAPAVSCAIYANGEIDPFSPMGVHESSPRRSLYAFLVEGASHHSWSHPSSPGDQSSVQAARSKIRLLVKDMLQNGDCLQA